MKRWRSKPPGWAQRAHSQPEDVKVELHPERPKASDEQRVLAKRKRVEEATEEPPCARKRLPAASFPESQLNLDELAEQVQNSMQSSA